MSDIDTSNYPSEYYSLNQQKALVITPAVTGLISILGSSVILHIVHRDWRQKLRFTYYRMLAIMSMIDIISSLNLALGAVANPKGVVWGALGTTFTCSLHGFFVEFGSAVPLYNVALSVYYLLVIRFKKLPTFVAKYAEPYFHAIAIGVPLLFAITAWSLDSLNPLFHLAGTCFINAYPPRCTHLDDLECTRGGEGGKTANILAFIAGATTYLISVVTMSVIMAIIVRQVRKEERSSIAADCTMSRSRQTHVQALLYVGAFFITYAPGAIKQFYGVKDNVSVQFILALAFKTLTPLQGFFNCIVFIRPRYVVWKLKQQNQDSCISQTGLCSMLYHLVFQDLSGPTAAEVSFAPELSVGAHGEPNQQECQAKDDASQGSKQSPYQESIRDRVIRQGREARAKTDQITMGSNSNDNPNGSNRIQQLAKNESDDDDSFLQDDDEEMAALRKIFFSL